MTNVTQWVDVCDVNDIDPEDVRRFDHQGRTYAVYRCPEGAFYCTDGLCTHEEVHLAEGMVIDHEIECPKHNATFDYRTGIAKRLPACVNLMTYSVRQLDGRVQIGLFP